MDSRIAENTRQFLAAAQAITPQDTLISGYCSRAEQEELYNEKVAGEVTKPKACRMKKQSASC